MYNLQTLIKYEYKKLLQRKAVWIVTLTLMAMAAASVILPPFMSVVSSNNDDGDSYTAYDSYKAQQILAADLKGRPLDDKLLKEMNDAYAAERESAEPITAFPESAVPYSAKYDDIDAWIDDVTYESGSPYISVDENGIPYFTGTAAQLYDIRRADLEKRWEQEYLSDEEKEFLTAVTFSVAAVLLLFLSTAVSSFAIYGTEGFNAQIQLSALECTWDLTVGQGVLIMFIISIAAAIMLSCTGLFLAECFRSSIPAMGILIGFLLISSILNIPGQFRVLSQIWSYCPAKLISLTGGLMDHRLIPFFGTYLASYQAGPFIYIILALLFAFGGYFVWRRWQAGGR